MAMSDKKIAELYKQNQLRATQEAARYAERLGAAGTGLAAAGMRGGLGLDVRAGRAGVQNPFMLRTAGISGQAVTAGPLAALAGLRALNRQRRNPKYQKELGGTGGGYRSAVAGGGMNASAAPPAPSYNQTQVVY
jgi:hypothetical protein